MEAVRKALPDRYQVVAAIASGCGLRQGEVFGLSLEDVDFLRRVVRVQRQLKIIDNQFVLALPKGRKTCDVPLPDRLALDLAAYVRRYPALNVSLPWGAPAGPERKVPLLLSSREGSH